MKNSFIAAAFALLMSCTLSKKAEDASGTNVNAASTAAAISMLDIAGSNPDGQTINVKEIKARYILVEFWASWCPPCRQFNPHLVKIYNTYQPKGFEVVSISLDKDATKWKNAIAKDGLRWPYHISDLKGWDSEWAVRFRIEEIPNSFLIDSTGKVIGSHLSYQELDASLAQLLK